MDSIRNITFRNLILLMVFLVYVIFSVALFVFFNNFYIKATRTEFVNENKGAVQVFKKLLNEEVEKLFIEARIFANDSQIYNAFVTKMYIDISHPSQEKFKIGDKITKVTKMNRFRYISLANKIKNQIGRNFGSKIDKEVGFFNREGELLGYTSEFKDLIRDVDIKKQIKNYLDIVDEGFALIVKHDDGYVLHAAYTVGESETAGFIFVSKKLTNEYLESIKEIINREVIFLDLEGNIVNSSIIFNMKRIKNEKVIFNKKNLEFDVGKERILFNLAPMIDTSGNLMGYLGTGFYLKDMQEMYFKSIKKFIPYELFFSMILFFILYFIIKFLFKPFNLIVTGIKKIKDGKYENLIQVNSSEELNSLSESINELAISLDQREKKLLLLNKEIEDTQKEVLLTLGSIAETRSKETSNHVKRVSEYSMMLASKYGLNESKIRLIKEASIMHDIGKIAIPDHILNKKGALTKEEFNIIKTHSDIGYQMLNKSNRELLKLAGKICLEHHEKWDGSGYPKGLKALEISIEGRITAVADVFDALSSDRVYKKAWSLDKILNYFESQRGVQFDPKLVDIFFENFDEFIRIRKKYKDTFEEKVAI